MTMSTGASTAVKPAVAIRPRRRIRWQRVALHAFLIALAALWLFPLAWVTYTALRPASDTIVNGYVTLPSTLNFDNFVSAWNQAELPHFFLNTMIVVVPALVLTLFISSMLGFAFSRFNFKFNIALLMMFTAGNLLPPQVIIVPLYRLYLLFPVPQPLSDSGSLYDQYIGIILIHVVFQTGFCTFVLSNYMKTLSRELTEAALVDGASVWMIYRRVILPLCRPALAALATLEFTFMYNDFFWALILMKTGDRRPITSALNNLQGAFFTDQNQLAAASLLVAIPTIVVYLVLSKHFVRGLTLGSTKG
ncbi:MAG: multiple sugar transport system permease protein [Chloroflexota bacterium]|nr:multiple sugar transport system permease protein [Chloroflexota bacterium]